MAEIRLTPNRVYTCGEYNAPGSFDVPLRVTKGKIKGVAFEKDGARWRERGRFSLDGPVTLPLSFDQQFEGIWKLTLTGIKVENLIGIDSAVGGNVPSLVDCFQDAVV